MINISTIVLISFLATESLADEDFNDKGHLPKPEQSVAASAPELDPNRFEVGVLPAFYYSSDAGLGFGALVDVVKFKEGREPFSWRVTALASATLRIDGEGNVDFPYHEDTVAIEVPGLWDGRLRLQGTARFGRNISFAYYGVGNASVRDETQLDNNPRRYAAQHTEPRLSGSARLRLFDTSYGIWDLVVGARVSGNWTEMYPGSKLEEDDQTLPAGDEARPRGIGTHANMGLSVGLLWDFRDQETVPTRGLYAEFVARGAGIAGAENAAFGGFGGDLRGYVPVWAPYLVLAARAKGDMIFGDAPYYELTSSGGINPISMGGGGNSIRGIPYGRYAGKGKVIGNLELRSSFLPFTVLDQRFRFGALAFVDTGRVWAELRDDPNRDGEGLGLKVGTGGGLRLRWGEHFVVRADYGYSPTEGTTGLYISVNHVF